MMDKHMVAMTFAKKIIRAIFRIVSFIHVNMMHDFLSSKSATQLLFYKIATFRNTSTVISSSLSNISIRVNGFCVSGSAIILGTTFLGTKLLIYRRACLKVFAAFQAGSFKRAMLFFDNTRLGSAFGTTISLVRTRTVHSERLLASFANLSS